MNPIIATKTLQAIDAAMQADSGARWRGLQRETLPRCEDAYDTKSDGHRTHLGASVLGQDCSRALWYGFHWVAKEKPASAMMRLWNRGHLEEGRMVASLLLIGVQVTQFTPDGKQFRISDFGGHFGGSLDAQLLGVPDMPGVPMLGEFKTHNDESFRSLIQKGMRESKFEHYVQMNIYMRKKQLPWGLYMATNKNNDKLHAELIELNPTVADQYTHRGGEIIAAQHVPPRINELPSWYQCGWCAFKGVCHQKGMPERNCRTCHYSYPAEDGTWRCGQFGHKAIPKDFQATGCGNYQLSMTIAQSQLPKPR